VFAEAYDKLLAEHAPHLVLRQGRAVSAAEGTLGWVILQYKKSDFLEGPDGFDAGSL